MLQLVDSCAWRPIGTQFLVSWTSLVILLSPTPSTTWHSKGNFISCTIWKHENSTIQANSFLLSASVGPGKGESSCPLRRMNHSYSCFCKIHSRNTFASYNKYDITLCHSSVCYTVTKGFTPYLNSKHGFIVINKWWSVCLWVAHTCADACVGLHICDQSSWRHRINLRCRKHRRPSTSLGKVGTKDITTSKNLTTCSNLRRLKAQKPK